jgi:hypothetical protein
MPTLEKGGLILMLIRMDFDAAHRRVIAPPLWRVGPTADSETNTLNVQFNTTP